MTVRSNELSRQQEKATYVGRIREEQNGCQQPFRVFEQTIQPPGGWHSVLQILPKPHRVDREQPALNPVEEKRNDPATENDESYDHAAASNAVVFSSRTSSIRLRPERRTVMARRGISSFVPEGGKYPSRVKTSPPMVSIPSASIRKPRCSLKSSRRALPLTRNLPFPSGSMYRSTSPLGTASLRISSMISSMVMIPSVPPNSSTTTPIPWGRVRKRFSNSSAPIVSETKEGAINFSV